LPFRDFGSSEPERLRQYDVMLSFVRAAPFLAFGRTHGESTGVDSHQPQCSAIVQIQVSAAKPPAWEETARVGIGPRAQAAPTDRFTRFEDQSPHNYRPASADCLFDHVRRPG